MWQPDDNTRETAEGQPKPWPVIRERLDHRLVGAYCAMCFDGYSIERVMRELGLREEEFEPAIRRGSEVYGHDVTDALRRFRRTRARTA